MLTIVEMLKQRALLHPDEICYTYLEDLDAESNLSYRQLHESAERLAHGLLQLAEKGDRVLLLMPSGLEYIQLYWACLYAGLVAVPLYPPKTNDRGGKVKNVIADCSPRLAILGDRLSQGQEAEFAAENLLFLLFSDIRTNVVAAMELSLPVAEDLSFLQYSSGSTGSPKGVMISHENIVVNVQALGTATETNDGDVFVNWLPLFHDMGMVTSILLPFYAGARSIIFSPLKFFRNPLFWFQVISKYRATFSGGPNFAYDQCVRKYSASVMDGLDLRSWRVALNAAEPVRSETLLNFAAVYAPAGFRESTFMPAYGMAEATVFLSAGELLEPPRIMAVDGAVLQGGRALPVAGTEPGAMHIVACGFAAENHEIVIVDQ